MRRTGMGVLRVIMVLFSFGISIGLVRSIYRHIVRRNIIDDHQAALVREQTRNASLIASLKEATSASFIEKQAREKLGLVKEGDVVVMLSQSGDSQESVPISKPLSYWERWWKLFF